MSRLRLSLATLMLAVVAACSGLALFARVLKHLSPKQVSPPEAYDLTGLFVAAIALTAAALAAWRGHSARQALMQMVVAYLGFLSAVGITEIQVAWQSERPMLYWYQTAFALLVVAPLVARRAIESGMEPGPRRVHRMQTCEAIALGFLTMLLVLAGIGIQWITVVGFGQLLNF